MPTAEFGQGQIFAPAKPAYMPSMAIRNATQPRRGKSSPKVGFINPLLGTIKDSNLIRLNKPSIAINSNRDLNR
jgi:hypothetical protein